MPAEVLEYLQGMGKKYGKLGGKTAAKNTDGRRTIGPRAKKASLAAAKKRTAERLAREKRAKDKA